MVWTQNWSLVVATGLVLLWTGACKADEVLFKNMEIEEVPDELIEIVDFETRKDMKGRMISNATIMIHGDIPMDAEVCIDGYEKMSNDYGKGYISLPCTSICDMIKDDDCIYPDLYEASHGTLPKEGCPFKKGKVVITNHLLELPCLPDKIQRNNDNWYFFIKVQQADQMLYGMKSYVEFKSPVLG